MAPADRERQRLEIRKIQGEENPADVLTKPKSFHDISRLLKKVGTEIKYDSGTEIEYDSGIKPRWADADDEDLTNYVACWDRPASDACLTNVAFRARSWGGVCRN